MKILITCGLKSEYNEARNKLSLKEITSSKSFPRVSIKKDVILIWTGIGKVNTTINLLEAIREFSPDLIIDSGTCGALNKELSIEDLVISLEAIEFYSYDTIGESFVLNDNLISDLELQNKNKFFKVASIEDSVNHNDKKKFLIKQECDIVTWETSTVFKIAQKNNINFISIRGVTDFCNENTFNDFKKNRLVVSKKVYGYISEVIEKLI